MAGYIAQALAHRILDTLFGGASFTNPSTIYFRLYTTLPNAAGAGGVSPSGGGYAPVGLTANTTNFPPGTDMYRDNGAVASFGTPSAGWGTIVGAAMADASSGGDLLWIGPLGTPRNALSGIPVSIPAGSASVTLANYLSVYAANQILDAVFNAAALAGPASWTLRLFTTLPDQTGAGGVAVTGGGYSDITVTNNSTNFPNAASQVKSNGAAFSFGTPSADWGMVQGFGFFDGSGNQWWAGPFAGGGRWVFAGTPFEIPVSGWTLTLL